MHELEKKLNNTNDFFFFLSNLSLLSLFCPGQHNKASIFFYFFHNTQLEMQPLRDLVLDTPLSEGKWE